MKDPRIGLIGATGAVGQVMTHILEERGFPLSDFVPFASARSAGERIIFQGEEFVVKNLESASLENFDIVIFSAGSETSAQFAPRFVDEGAIVVDNSSYFRTHSEVPLVVVGINEEEIKNHRGIIANPNCTTMILTQGIWPLERQYSIKRLVLVSLQAVSGGGRAAIRELKLQNRALALGEEIPLPIIYPHQIADNVFPQAEEFAEGSLLTSQEIKMNFEAKKIFARPDMQVSATCTRVPIETGHSISANIEFETDFDLNEVADLLRENKEIIFYENPEQGGYPTALLARGEDRVLVGRLRKDPERSRTLELFVSGDNLRKGAATNAVRIAEEILK